MQTKQKPQQRSPSPHARIVIGLPDLQHQIRMINKLSANASEPELQRMKELAHMLCELYAQLQHQKQVLVFRGAKAA